MQKYEFPIVGTPYINGAYEMCCDADKGVPLHLEPEPTNAHDKYAIKVMLDDQHIGYVPNRGYSCSKCWNSADGYDFACTSCGASNQDFVTGGLARRLFERKTLQADCGCFIVSINPNSKANPVKAQLVAANIYS